MGTRVYIKQHGFGEIYDARYIGHHPYYVVRDTKGNFFEFDDDDIIKLPFQWFWRLFV